MKKFLIGLMMVAGAVTAQASSDGMRWDKAPDLSTDQSALQHGAKLFVNYCLNCHSAAFMRYNRLKDIGLTDQQIKDNLMFTTDKVGDTMVATLNPKQAKEMFGANPPDLTLVARSRAGSYGSGSDYLYTYLRTFYPDPTRPTGWNNMAFPNVGMPHVLWELQGQREPIYETVTEHGHETHVFKGWKQVTPGTLSPQEFDKSMADLVAYMKWMAEPAQATRVQLGVWVMMFLLVFFVIAWRLNAAFWKDIR